MGLSLDLKLIEKMIPKSPPLAGRRLAFQCDRCHAATLLDERVFQLPGVRLLSKARLAGVRCEACGNAAMRFRGYAMS